MSECIEKKPKKPAEEGYYRKTPRLTARDGTVVSLHSGAGGEKITVCSELGQIIVEYYPESRKCHLYVPVGDLHLNAPMGSLSLASGRDIKLQCPGDILIKGDSHVELRSGRQPPTDAAISLRKNKAKISGTKVTINAEQGDLSIVKSRIRSRSLAAKIDRACVSLDNLELFAERMHQKNKIFYQRVENLFQINAGKMRTFVRGLFNLKGKRTYLKADKDMKLKGEKIHLR